MKTIKLLLFAAVFFTGIKAGAQTVDEIVGMNIEAMGGKDKIATLKTVKMTGSMSVQGTDVSLVMTKSHLIGARLDLEVMGTSNYQLANTTKGFVFMPVMGMASPQEMDEDQLKSFITQMDVQGTLVNYKEKGSKIELAGKESVDGADAYKLVVTYKNGKTANYFVDAKTNRVIKTSSKATVQGQEMDIETTFGDYKQNADGFWFPYLTTNMQGTVSYDKIETNMPVDEKIFTN